MQLGKTHYTNGQRVWELNGSRLTYYYKSGKIKAEGGYTTEKMQGEWKFYNEAGRLIQIGHFKDDLKHGAWTRYDGNGNITYDESFADGKIQKK